jgi:hypothetical protein
MNDSRQALGSRPEPGTQIEEAVPPAIQPTRLAVRLWPHSRPNLKWASELSVVYLLADLVSASKGSLVNDATYGLIAHFEHPADAYRAAKRSQWALLEFCQQRPDLCLGAAMVLYEDGNTPGKNGDSDSHQVAALLERCRPAQVLVSGKTGSHLQDLPGLQLRSLNSGSRSRGEWQGGAQEVLWTTSSNLEQIQQRLKEVAQNLVLQQESVQPEPVAAPEPITVSDQPTLDFANAGGYRSAPTLVQNEPPTPPHTPIEVENVERVSVSELLEDDSEHSGSRYLWLSLAAVVIIGVLVFLFFSKQRPKQAVSDTPTPTPVSQPQEPVSPVESPVVAQPPQDTPPTPAPKTSDVPKPPAHRATVDQPPQKTPKKASEYQGMTEKDIPLLLRKAEKDAGAGNYEDARREFDIILHLDPGNAEAKQGMRKLELSERETR